MTNDFINNMDELQAEHLAEKQTAEAKAKAEQEAKWEAERIEHHKVEAIARAKRNAHQSITLRKIAEQVVLQKHKAEVIEADAKLIIDGVDTQWRLDFKQERSHQSSWRSTPFVGSWIRSSASRTQLPPAKLWKRQASSSCRG